MSQLESAMENVYRESIEEGKIPAEIPITLKFHQLALLLGLLLAYEEMFEGGEQAKIARSLHDVIDGQAQNQITVFETAKGGRPN